MRKNLPDTNLDLVPTIKEGIELGLYSVSHTFSVTVDSLCCIAIGDEVNLFSHVNTTKGKRFFTTKNARKTLCWKVEELTGQAKVDRHGILTGHKEGTVLIKLFQNINGEWFQLCSKEIKVVDIILPKVQFLCYLKSNYGKSNDKSLKSFNAIECIFKNQSQKEIKVWHNLNVKELDWRILWASPIGETTAIKPGEEKVINFSTASGVMDLQPVRVISYTFDCDGKTIAVYYDVFTKITTFCVVQSRF